MDYSYEDEMMITGEFLDKIDILSYIPTDEKYSSYTIDRLMEDLEQIYESPLCKHRVPDDDFFEGSLFNHMNTEEFQEYLEKRYGRSTVKFREVTTTYVVHHV